jgi:hypothetical protein
MVSHSAYFKKRLQLHCDEPGCRRKFSPRGHVADETVLRARAGRQAWRFVDGQGRGDSRDFCPGHWDAAAAAGAVL